MSDLITTEVLVLGTGIAGCTAAWTLAEKGVAVTLVTRVTEPSDTNTDWAQGGIIYKGEEDSAELLITDLLNAGDGHVNPIAAQILADEGPKQVEKLLLDTFNVQFTRKANGDLSIVLEGAHAAPRIIHAADATGHAIQIALLNKIKQHPNITLLTNHTAIDLLSPSHHSRNRRSVYNKRGCVGAYVFDRDTKTVKRILAEKTILATGGLGQIFLRSTNPKGSRGDGLAMAYRAGARVINSEFVQFHPTTFYKTGAPSFLITEAVRGEGGRLVHADGRPFMDNYAPKWKDLAPRDVVSRSIMSELVERDVKHVYLNLRSYMSAEHIRHHFPNILQQCAEYGIDMTTDLVPVVPGAHYFCGGVWVDMDGQTTIDNLYAVGEVSCTGLHGANRLASSSLLEGLVWGVKSAEHAHTTRTGNLPIEPSDIPQWQDTGVYEPDPVLVSQDMNTIKNVMWNYVGLSRAAFRMNRAIRELRHLETEIERFYKVSKLTDDLIGVRNAVRAALIVAAAANANKQSMGCHFREDVA
ncbi:MAG: L-aspartate oxidase [Candidatus Promineifilaceae bacterium]